MIVVEELLGGGFIAVLTVYALAALKSLMTGDADDFWEGLAKKKPPVRRQVVSKVLDY